MSGPQAAAPGAPLSPCIGLCLLDPEHGYCRGCLRSIEEISGWSRAGDGEKQRILTAVAERRQQLAAGD